MVTLVFRVTGTHYSLLTVEGSGGLSIDCPLDIIDVLLLSYLFFGDVCLTTEPKGVFLKLSAIFGSWLATPAAWSLFLARAKLITDFKIKFEILVWKKRVIEEFTSGP